MSSRTSTQDLIGQIEKKDRRFRLAQSAFLIIIALGIVATSAFLYTSILQSQKRNEAAIAKQTEFIRCIARAYTSATDGQRVTIKDLDKCKISVEAKPTPQPTATLQVESAPASSAPLVVTNPAPVGFTQPPASDSSPATPPQQDPGTPPQQPPAEVLGIPVCVPLTNVCVRQ